MRIAGRTLFPRRYFVFTSLPFSNICKKSVHVKNVSKFLRKLRHCFTRNKIADAQEFISVFGEFLSVLCYFRLYCQ